jgi:paraquat-inducible protein A
VTLHFRKPGSIGRTWALLFAACILYIPANLMPIMITSSVFDTQADTIISGVVYLWTSGSWPIAVVVFVASVMVPVLKLLALCYLLICVQLRVTVRARERAQIHRVLVFVGRWSMLDVFVVALLVALVHIEALATVQAGPGAAAFGAVVLLTMFAYITFDPRLIWDAAREEPHE